MPKNVARAGITPIKLGAKPLQKPAGPSLTKMCFIIEAIFTLPPTAKRRWPYDVCNRVLMTSMGQVTTTAMLPPIAPAKNGRGLKITCGEQVKMEWPGSVEERSMLAEKIRLWR